LRNSRVQPPPPPPPCVVPGGKSRKEANGGSRLPATLSLSLSISINFPPASRGGKRKRKPKEGERGKQSEVFLERGRERRSTAAVRCAAAFPAKAAAFSRGCPVPSRSSVGGENEGERLPVGKEGRKISRKLQREGDGAVVVAGCWVRAVTLTLTGFPSGKRGQGTRRWPLVLVAVLLDLSTHGSPAPLLSSFSSAQTETKKKK
jgi:hypothetical protein